MKCAHRRIQSGKELVGDQYLAAGKRSHQGGLAGVGVADQRDAGDFLSRLTGLPFLPPRTLCLALGIHCSNFKLQFGNAIADFLPVQGAMRFASTASAGAAALPALWPRQLRRFAKARRQIAQPRNFDLRARCA